MTLQGRTSFDDDWWGQPSGLALQVCGVYVLRAVHLTLRQQNFTSHSFPEVSRRPFLTRTGHRYSPLLRCNLVDFHTDQKGSVPRLSTLLDLDPWVGSAAEKVVRWITSYFSPSHLGVQTVNDVLNGAVTVTERMPLVLQHAGHSRTVVGYEVERNGECNILVFDPSKCVRSVILSSPSSSRPITRQLRPPLRTAAVGPQDSVRMSLGPPRDRKLMDRIKDTVFSPINEMKARKRKASPAVIDLTRPTQKRPRSASSSDIVVLDEPIETSEPINVDVESQPGRPPPIELKDEQSSTRVDVMEGMLSWSRLSMKQIRLASSSS